MSTKTDLAKEIIGKIFPEYSGAKKFFFGGTEIFEISINTAEDSALFEKPVGKYVTIESESLRFPFEKFDEEALALASVLKKMLPEEGDILAVGMGNAFLTADSLGPLAMEDLICRDFFGRKLLAISPGVFGRTGIEPEKLILSAVEKFKPATVIAVDSLCAEEITNICKTIQLCDSGIFPGSAFGRKKSELSLKTLGVPVISVGTPTVSLAAEEDSVFVSPFDIDVLIKRAAKLISLSINLAVFPQLGIDFIKGIIL